MTVKIPWEHGDGDVEWVKKYVQEQFAAWTGVLDGFLYNFNMNQWWLPDGLVVELSGVGGGETYPWEPRIVVNWGLEMAGHRILWHEFGHLMAYRHGMEGDWGQWGHGTPQDWLMRRVGSQLCRLYWSNPGDECQLRVQHKENGEWVTLPVMR